MSETLLLRPYYKEGCIEAGCDEAGRGCLAGPVFGAAVIFPPDYRNKELNDSKKLTEKKRYRLREQIHRDAVAWAVGEVDNLLIDKLNILNASILSMHVALAQLPVVPQFIIVDGNRFKPWGTVPYECIVKGDGKYLSIAAASILAKTGRDDLMLQLHDKYPQYRWDINKGYPTKTHRQAINRYGVTPLHRLSFNMGQQLALDFGE